MTAAQAKARSFRAKLKARLRDKSVSIDARALWAIIESFANRDGSNAFPSRPRLADICGKRVAWVDKYVRELRAAGWLFKETVPAECGRRNVFTVVYPDLIDRAALPPHELTPRPGQLAPPSEEHYGSFEQWSAREKEQAR